MPTGSGPRPLSTYYFFRFVTPFVLGSAAALYLFLFNGFDLSLMNKLCACLVAFAIGFYAPSLYISNIAQKRRASIVGVLSPASSNETPLGASRTTGANVDASISARKLSNGTTRSIISSGSPFAEITASRLSASKKPN